jgi:hypothetical protein
MNFSQIRQGLLNATRLLERQTQLNNVKVDVNDRSISWLGRKPGIVKGLYYPLEYQFLIDTHQYSMLLTDGSFFQFFYQFDENDKLTSARLAFYPRPLATRETIEEMMQAADDAVDREDDELFDHLYNWTELMEVKSQLPSNTSHIRFDYDPGATTHSPAHLQLSGLHEMRIAANYVPQPLAFVQLCEASYATERTISSAGLAFEKNHALILPQPTDLISLAWPAAE